MRNELLIIKVSYGADNQVLNLKSIHLTPEMASKLVEAISVMVLGWPELDTLEQPENIKSTPKGGQQKDEPA